MTTSEEQPEPPVTEGRLREILLLVVQNRIRILWQHKIREKLAYKHGLSDKDVFDVYERWEVLKKVEFDNRSWRYTIEGENSIGDWMRTSVALYTDPEMIVVPITCYRCVRSKKK